MNAVSLATTSVDSSHALESLIELIYESALDTEKYRDFAIALSDALGGHAVTVRLQQPDAPDSAEVYRSHEGGAPEEVFEKHWLRGLPWGKTIPAETPASETTRGFVEFDEQFPGENLADTDYYEEWLRPRGLQPLSPITHVFAREGDKPTGVVTLENRVGLPPIGRYEIEFADQLCPHLARAHRILDLMRSMRHEQDVFRDVLDRLPSGLVLVDEDGRVVVMNESARLSMGPREGSRIGDGRPVVEDPNANRRLQEALGRALDPRTRTEFQPAHWPVALGTDHGGVPMMVTPLLAPASRSSLPDISALVLFGNPQVERSKAVDMLRTLYDLTRAEAEVSWLLAEGHTLEETAAQRGVTVNTARSQLKRVFAKTGVRRQPDLVRIVLVAVGSIRGPR